MTGSNKISKRLKEKVNSIKESKYSIPIFLATVYLATVWTIFTPCLANLLLPIISLVILVRFFKETDLKKIAVIGLIAVILVSLTGAAYQFNVYYSEPKRTLSSEHISNATVDRIYGSTDEPFNFTADLSEDLDHENVTIFLNLTYDKWTEAGAEKIAANYTLKRVSNTSSYYRSKEIGERKYFHQFILRINGTNATMWEKTGEGYGPMTISKQVTFTAVTIQRMPIPVLIYFFLISLLWWKRKMDRSKKKSTEGLEDKEKDLDDYCPECGTLLEGEDVCPNCGEDVSGQLDEEAEPKNYKDKEKKRTECTNCGRNISTSVKSCPYCGEDIENIGGD